MSDSIVEAMRAAPIWLVWKAIAEPGKSKPRKVPYYVSGAPRSGVLDSPEERAQLVCYDDALSALERSFGIYAGLAIALGPDGRGGHWQGIDLDDMLAKGVTDIADLWTRGSCAGLGYVEMSPSGNGIHLIGYGRPFQSLGSNSSGIEAYAGGRFFTFTEQPIVGDSPCFTYDLADYVEQVLSPRHSAGRAASAGTEEPTAENVDAKTVTELRSALLSMQAEDRVLWVAVGHALKKLGGTGRALFMEWSATSLTNFDPKDAAAKWATFNPQHTAYQAVFKMAQERGWVNPASNAAQAGRVTIDLGEPPAARKLVGRSLSGVAMRAIEWLWVGWLPKGYITIFAGETGAGKSTALADIAARITTGAPWPGEYDCPNTRRVPERVLWLGSEDSIEEMTIPRLKACGANLDNVIEIQGAMQNGKRNTFSMQDDIEQVADWLAYAREQGNPFAMLVIDPVTSYLPGQKLKKVDMNDAGQLRTILEPWLPLAQKFNIAIVCVTHFAKDTTKSMVHRVMGSSAFAQTCRSLCAVIQQQAKEDEEPEPHAKALIQVKVNLPEHPGGAWKFSTERVEVGTDPRNGKPIFATKPAWDELDTALTPSSAIGKPRGPKSQYEVPFAMWMQAHFLIHPNHEWLPVSTVRQVAVGEKIVSESWWNKHSMEYMDKENVKGEWMCRPKQRPA